jgi:hypothetical protein
MRSQVLYSACFSWVLLSYASASIASLRTSHFIGGCRRIGHRGVVESPSLTSPAASHAHCYFAPDRFLLRQAEEADSAGDFHPAYPGVIFRQFDVRDLDVSWSIRLAHQVDVEASLSQEQIRSFTR